MAPPSSIASYCGDIGPVKKLISTYGSSYFDNTDFTVFTDIFNKEDLDIFYPKQKGCGRLFPPPQYLVCGRYIREWRTYDESKQQYIYNKNISPSIDDEEVTLLKPATPPKLPPNFCKIDRKDCYQLAMDVNLQHILTITGNTILNPKQLGNTYKVPIHYRGACRNWIVVLHNILYFYDELSKEQQLEEIQKACHISSYKKRKYNSNIKYLHSNRLLFDLSKQMEGGECKVCGFTLSPDIMSHEHYQRLTKGTSSAACPQCLQIYQSLKLKCDADKKTIDLLSRQINDKQLPNYSVPPRTEIVNLHKVLRRDMPNSHGSSIIDLIKEKFKLRVIILSPSYTEEQHEEIHEYCSGAELPKYLHHEGNVSMHNHPNLINVDDFTQTSTTQSVKYDGVLVILKQHDSNKHDDYALLMNADFDPTDLEEYISEEDTVIQQYKLNPRIGPASGNCLISDQCKRLSDATRGTDTFYYSTPLSPALHCIYRNSDTGKVIDTSWGYKDTLSRVVEAKTKQKLYKQSKSYTSITAEQGICCISALAAISALATLYKPTRIRDANGRKVKVKEVGKKFSTNTDYYGLEPATLEQPVGDDGSFIMSSYLSLLDDIIENRNDQEECFNARAAIAEFMCLFESTLNYSANAGHVDQHGPEVLNIFHRHKVTESPKQGYLWIPQYNVVLVFQVDKTTSTGDLTQTIHFADKSRDNKNFSSSLWVDICPPK